MKIDSTNSNLADINKVFIGAEENNDDFRFELTDNPNDYITQVVDLTTPDPVSLRPFNNLKLESAGYNIKHEISSELDSLRQRLARLRQAKSQSSENPSTLRSIIKEERENKSEQSPLINRIRHILKNDDSQESSNIENIAITNAIEVSTPISVLNLNKSRKRVKINEINNTNVSMDDEIKETMIENDTTEIPMEDEMMKDEPANPFIPTMPGRIDVEKMTKAEDTLRKDVIRKIPSPTNDKDITVDNMMNDKEIVIDVPKEEFMKKNKHKKARKRINNIPTDLTKESINNNNIEMAKEHMIEELTTLDALIDDIKDDVDLNKVFNFEILKDPTEESPGNVLFLVAKLPYIFCCSNSQ